MRSLFIIAAGLMLMLSCSAPEVEPHEGNPDTAEDVEVCFELDLPPEAKSSLDLNETYVRNVNVYAFRDGMLAGEVYAASASGAVLKLQKGYTYNIYAVANMGRCPAYQNESRFVATFRYSIENISELAAGIPMSCVVKNVYVGRASQTMRLQMQRKAARVTLSVDKSSVLDGLKVKSVRLCQSASVVRPFKNAGSGGSRAESVREVMDGDFATSADLQRLESGEGILFYALENCQGVLLPENTDPSMKVPDMISGKKGLCTYLDVICSFDGSGLLEGDVEYRIYLGLDSCTSFDLPGNASVNVELMLTADGLKDVSWKVEADVSVRDGYVSGAVSEGMHGVAELYVGEELLYEVEFAEPLMAYLGGDASGCTLQLMKDGETVPALRADVLDGDGTVLQSRILCAAPAEGSLYVSAPDGSIIGCLEENVRISLPEIVFSEYPVWMDDEPVEGLTYVPECEVNGTRAEVYLYFTDADGYNLNGGHSYGFDASLFELSCGGTTLENVTVDAVHVIPEYLEHSAGRAAAEVVVACDNDGSDHGTNLLLSDIYASGRSAVTEIRELNYDMAYRFPIGLGIPPVVLTLVDNGWAGYHDCQLSMKVDNPSNLPLDVSVWQLISTNSAYGPVDSDYVEEKLRIDQIDYMTGAFYNDEVPLYGSYSSFRSERNDEGDQAEEDGSVLIYPLDGISTEDIIMAANYKHRGAGQMIHVVEASVAGYRINRSDLKLEDNVSDGSARYDYIYYSSESWNYRGAGLCSSDMVYVKPQNWGYDYPNMTPGRLERLVERYDAGETACVDMLYNPDKGRTSVMTYAGMGAQYGLTLDFRYSGTVNGYVQTHPNGTWGKSQDNYCSAVVSHTKSGVPLVVTGHFVWADDGGVKSAMDEIYGYSYKDSDRPLGADAYMHHAHPTDMLLEMNLSVEGDEGSELYPYYIRWEEDFMKYYHEQEDMTYKCTLNPVTKAYNISVVRHW